MWDKRAPQQPAIQCKENTITKCFSLPAQVSQRKVVTLEEAIAVLKNGYCFVGKSTVFPLPAGTKELVSVFCSLRQRKCLKNNEYSALCSPNETTRLFGDYTSEIIDLRLNLHVQEKKLRRIKDVMHTRCRNSRLKHKGMFHYFKRIFLGRKHKHVLSRDAAV